MKHMSIFTSAFCLCFATILFTTLEFACADPVTRYDCAIESENGTINFYAHVNYNMQKDMVSFAAERINWNNASLDTFLSVIKYLTANQPTTRYELDEGTVVLLSEQDGERIAFLNRPQESLHYMTYRSDNFFERISEENYRSTTTRSPNLSDVFCFNNNTLKVFAQLEKFLQGEEIIVGPPFEMTAFYFLTSTGKNSVYPNNTPDEIIVAFLQMLDGVRMMPWGQKSESGFRTFHTYIRCHIDAQGISDIEIPLIFSKLTRLESKQIMSLDQAVSAFKESINSLLFPFEQYLIDYIALEYAPIQQNSQCIYFDIIPVWSFYSNYEDDDTRFVISLNAYTGERVF